MEADLEEAIKKVLNKEDDTPKPELKFITIGDLLNKEFPPQSWIIEHLAPKQGLVAISGTPGSYKSWLTEYIALSVSQGKSLFNQFNTSQAPVLVIDQENILSLLQERFKALGAATDAYIYLLDMDFSIENNTQVGMVAELIKNKNIGLVIIDSLIRIHRGDENTSKDMAKVFSQLRKLQNAGATVIFTHHHRKQHPFGRSSVSDNLRGSSDILAAVDSHLAVEKLEDGIKVLQPKLRQAQALTGFMLEFTGKEFIYKGEVQEDKQKLEMAKEDVLVLLEESELTRKEIIDQLSQTGNYGRDTVDKALKELETDKKVNSHFEGRTKFYVLFPDTYIDQDIRTYKKDNVLGQDIDQDITPKPNLKTNVRVQDIHQDISSHNELSKFKGKIKGWDTPKLEMARERGEQWFTDNSNAPAEITEEKNHQLMAIIDELSRRTGEEAINTFTKGGD